MLARQLARVAIRQGEIARDDCAVCGTQKTEIHHPDYDRPYFLVWLCSPHHRHVHKLISSGQADAARAIEAFALDLTPAKRRGG